MSILGWGSQLGVDSRFGSQLGIDSWSGVQSQGGVDSRNGENVILDESITDITKACEAKRFVFCFRLTAIA
mgnify:CR=1 FL=1